VTRWLDYYFNIWPFRTLKIWPNNKNVCQSRFTILPKSKYLLQKWPNTFFKFCLSGKISPYLFTLEVNNKFKVAKQFLKLIWTFKFHSKRLKLLNNGNGKKFKVVNRLLNLTVPVGSKILKSTETWPNFFKYVITQTSA